MSETQAIAPLSHALTLEPFTSLTLAQAAQLATAATQARVLQDYQERKAEETLRRQRADLAAFVTCLAAHTITVPANLTEDLSAWGDMEYGLVELFVRWQAQQGYAVRTIDARLSTVKVYCRLAAKAGYLSTERLALIAAVEGYAGRDAINVDLRRPVTRRGAKKALPVEITASQVELLKDRPDTPDGRRGRSAGLLPHESQSVGPS